MNETMKRPEQAALPIDKSASALGLDEFSLLSRIQAGEINAVRARLGEMMIPQSELERLAPVSLRASINESGEQQRFSDSSLGIKSQLGLRHNGVRSSYYKVPGHEGQFSENEIKGYRAAFGAISQELQSVEELKRQLSGPGEYPDSCEFEINTPQTGQWEIHSALLNLKRGEILLCQRDDEFAVIEHLTEDSPYSRANGKARILMQGNDARQLKEDLKADANLTLEFMASNLTAKAQRIIWEQYPEQISSDIVAAISERCRQSVGNEETISQAQKMGEYTNQGIRM